MTRTIAYIRVSTDKQADSGISLDAQRAKVHVYAELYDLEIVRIEEDAGASAKTLDRPALQRALTALEDGEAESLLVVKLDRLTRSVRDLGHLLETYFSGDRWSLVSVSEQFDTRSAVGRLVLHIMASVSQWEREVIGERTAAAMQHLRAQGRYTGGHAPYGYRRTEDGTLTPDADEQATVAAARALRDEDGLCPNAIARALTDAGHRTRTDTAFQAIQIKRMLAAA